MQRPALLLFCLVAAESPPVAAAKEAEQGRLRSRDTGAPVLVAPVFNHEPPVQVTPVSGFCLQRGNAPKCFSIPCCCWSTFSTSEHMAYPNEEEAADGRRCLNPPGGYTYVRQPGFTHDDGDRQSLGMDGSPRFPGRDLCCLMSNDNPAIYSMQEPAHGAEEFRDTQRFKDHVEEEGVTLDNAKKRALKEAMKITHPKFASAPAPAPAVAAASPSAPTDLLVNQDYETLQMEEAARANLRSAELLKASAASMSQSIADISQVKTQLATNPELLRRKQRVHDMREAVRTWAGKRWHNLQHMGLGDAAGMIH